MYVVSFHKFFHKFFKIQISTQGTHVAQKTIVESTLKSRSLINQMLIIYPKPATPTFMVTHREICCLFPGNRLPVAILYMQQQ